MNKRLVAKKLSKKTICKKIVYINYLQKCCPEQQLVQYNNFRNYRKYQDNICMKMVYWQKSDTDFLEHIIAN